MSTFTEGKSYVEVVKSGVPTVTQFYYKIKNNHNLLKAFIASLVLSNYHNIGGSRNCVVFGGMIRDLLAEMPVNDIDLLIEGIDFTHVVNENGFDEVISEKLTNFLHSNGIPCSSVEVGRYPPPESSSSSYFNESDEEENFIPEAIGEEKEVPEHVLDEFDRLMYDDELSVDNMKVIICFEEGISVELDLSFNKKIFELNKAACEQDTLIFQEIHTHLGLDILLEHEGKSCRELLDNFKKFLAEKSISTLGNDRRDEIICSTRNKKLYIHDLTKPKRICKIQTLLDRGWTLHKDDKTLSEIHDACHRELRKNNIFRERYLDDQEKEKIRKLSLLKNK